MSASLKDILLATDGSRDAEVALRAAADISEKSGAALHVVHVCTERCPLPSQLGTRRLLPLSRGGSRKLLRRQAWNARAAGGRPCRGNTSGRASRRRR